MTLQSPYATSYAFYSTSELVDFPHHIIVFILSTFSNKCYRLRDKA